LITTPQPVTIETPSNNYWAFALIFFPLFTIFGNVLVVVSVYREKSLHTITNYFVVSLAISDITVAAVVMPFAIYLEVSKNKNRKLSISYSYAVYRQFVFIFSTEMRNI
jgi:dopamine D2-like receptor